MAGLLDEMAFRPPAGLLPEWWGGSGFMGMSPHEIAAMRQRQTAQPMMGRKEGAGTQFIEDVMLPKTPLDAALFAVGGVPGKVAKAATLAAGAALSSDDADAGPLGRLNKLFHGSPRKDLTSINPSDRGPLGPGVYTSEAPQVAGHYAGSDGRVYELPGEGLDVYRGAGHRSEDEWFDFKRDQQRLIGAAEPDRRAQVEELVSKMWSNDGYPLYQRIRHLYGSDQAAQELYRRAGFKGISGLVDGPETVIFDPVRVSP